MNERLLKLRDQLNELMEWQQANSLQQITYPLGVHSQNLIKHDVVYVTGKLVAEADAPVDFPNTQLEVISDGIAYLLPCELS